MIRALLALLLGLLVCGCATSQEVPAEIYTVRVVDRETGLPIEGAQVQMVFAGVSRTFSTMPVVTDAGGEATLIVPKKALPLRFGEGYFAGGYIRTITSTKEGYETAAYAQGPNGLPKHLIVEQKAIRNRFGAIRFASFSDLDAKRVLATFDIIDGPRSGTKLVLPIFRVQAISYFMDKKYYLEEPVSAYEQRYTRSPEATFSLTNGFRAAVKDEPYSGP